MFEGILENASNSLSGSFNFLYNTLELKNHQNKQMHKNLLKKLTKVQQENEELKRKVEGNCFFQPDKQVRIKESSFENIKFGLSTPRVMKPILPSSTEKQKFDFTPFDEFFSKK